MKLRHNHAISQRQTPLRSMGHGVALLCFLLLSVNVACAAMSFPEKATASITSIDANSGVIFAKDSASGQVFQFKLTNPALLHSLKVGQAFFVDIANKLVSFDGSRINGNIVGLGPVDGVKPLGPVDGVKPVGPVDGVKPVGPVDGAKPFGPIDGVKPLGPVDGAKPIGPIDGVKPVGPVDGAKPFGPIDGVKPVGPVDGAKPFGPIDGAKPVGPVDGAKPLGPVDGVRPVGPVDGARPAAVIDGGVTTCTITSIDAGRGLITARNNQTGRTFQFRPSNASFFQSLKPGQAVFADFARNQVSLGENPSTIGSIVSATSSATHK